MRSFTNFLKTYENPRCRRSVAISKGGIDTPKLDIMLREINSELIEAYEIWMRSRGNTPNTSSFYLRILRAVYNRAVESGMVNNRYPFKRVYTGIDQTKKRAIQIQDIRKLKILDLSLHPDLEYARDMFLLSFYLRGMSFVDMAFLKKNDLQNGILTYRRRKTGQILQIAWTPEMQNMLEKYPENQTQYLLPILYRHEVNDYYAYRNVSFKINYNLKKVGLLVGIAEKLTLYVARHSWATAAKTIGIPIAIISEGMGHNSECTTQIYLASLETSIIDRANHLIIESLE